MHVIGTPNRDTVELMPTPQTIQQAIASQLRSLRAHARPPAFDPTRIARYDVRLGHCDGQPVKRLVLHLRSNGCVWCRQTGGCAMCGFWNETAQGRAAITAADVVTQFKRALEDLDMRRYPAISLYNAGSLLHEDEIPFDAVVEIFTLMNRHLPDLRKVTIESRVEYIDPNKVRTLQKLLGNSTHLAIGIGFESHNETIRNGILNKGLSKEDFERCLTLLHTLGVAPIVYVLIKPPFLTEREAIDEAVAGTRYVSQLEVAEIHYETMTIEEHTMIHQLYEQGHYQVPWLWSLIEIIRRVQPFAHPFVTPCQYITVAKAIPMNCPACSERVRTAIYQQYCTDFALAHFDGIQCHCEARWEQALQEQNPMSLHDRVFRNLLDMEKGQGTL